MATMVAPRPALGWNRMMNNKPRSDRRMFLQTATGVLVLGRTGLHVQGAELTDETELRFGVVADCQFADAPAAGTRHYRNSEQKLRR